MFLTKTGECLSIPESVPSFSSWERYGTYLMSFSTCSQGILIAKNKGDLKIAQTTYPKTLLRRAEQWYSESSLLVVTYGVREKPASFSYLEQKSCKICKLVNEQLCSYGMSENRWNHFSWGNILTYPTQACKKGGLHQVYKFDSLKMTSSIAILEEKSIVFTKLISFYQTLNNYS